MICWMWLAAVSLENLVRNLSPSDAALFKRCYAVLQQSLSAPATDSDAAPAFTLPKCITSAILGGPTSKVRSRVLGSAGLDTTMLSNPGDDDDEEDDDDDEEEEEEVDTRAGKRGAAKGKAAKAAPATLKRKGRPSLHVDVDNRFANGV